MKKSILKKYMKDPDTCPYCGSDMINAGDADFSSREVWRNITCTNCHKEWTDEYKLVRAEEVET